MSTTGNDSLQAGPPSSLRWGFIGAGKMATALAQGLIRAGALASEELRFFDPAPAAREAMQEATGGRAEASNIEVAASSDVLVLAVKPQSMNAVLVELAPAVARQLVVSVAAGVRIETMQAALGSSTRLIRVMPNTPALVGEGAAGYCLGAQATQEDEAAVRRCLESVGRAVRVDEPLMDVVTGLGGSGPAFVYVMIEALSDGALAMGLPRDVATTLAAQTVLGAARMVLETGKHPGALKDEVTSPGGTTIAGLHALERGGFRAAVMDAVAAATRRSAELSSQPRK